MLKLTRYIEKTKQQNTLRWNERERERERTRRIKQKHTDEKWKQKLSLPPSHANIQTVQLICLSFKLHYQLIFTF